MDHFKDYLPILTALIAILSAAIFGFLLPKWADYFNDRPRTKLKDTLDIKEGLETAGRSVSPELNQIIAYYETEFIRKESEFINTCERCRDKKHNKYINTVFGLFGILTLVSLLLYFVILGILHWLGI